MRVVRGLIDRAMAGREADLAADLVAIDEPFGAFGDADIPARGTGDREDHLARMCRLQRRAGVTSEPSRCLQQVVIGEPRRASYGTRSDLRSLHSFTAAFNCGCLTSVARSNQNDAHAFKISWLSAVRAPRPVTTTPKAVRRDPRLPPAAVRAPDQGP